MEKVDVADVHVGVPPGPLSSWIRRVHFHGFEGLTTARDEEVLSSKFSCFGHHQWRVAIYPGGSELSEEDNVSVYLRNASPESIQVHFKIVLKHPTNQTQRSFETGSGDEMMTFKAKVAGSAKHSWGDRDFATRETMLEYLNNGTLTLEIHLSTNRQTEPTSFVPSNPFNDNMLRVVFNNKEKSDVTFEVGGEVESTADLGKNSAPLFTQAI